MDACGLLRYKVTPAMLFHQDFAVRLYLCTYVYDFFHDRIEFVILCINGHFLHHKADICIVDSRDFFDRIFHFCCTVCTIQSL